jgi:starch phosphorylase
VATRKQRGSHAPVTISSSPLLAEALDSLDTGCFSPGEPDRFRLLTEELRHRDRFMITADFDAYWAEQRRVDGCWDEPERWWRSSILNTARIGWFSSDRTIREYADEIWRVPLEDRGGAA